MKERFGNLAKIYIAPNSLYQMKFKILGLLTIVWLIIQVSLFWRFGIIAKDEALKYINEAIYWDTHGKLSEPKYLFYSAYIFVHWITNKLGWGLIGVYIIQLIWNGAATYFFYRLNYEHSKNIKQSLTATILLMFLIPFQSWNVHLYTESFFLSTIIIASYFWFKPNKKQIDHYFQLFLLVIIILSRPTGLLFIPICLIVWSAVEISRKKWLSVIFINIFVVAAFYFLINKAMKGEGGFDFLKPFIEGHIICGVPELYTPNLNLPKNGNSIEGLLYFVWNNSKIFLKFGIKKIVYFFGLSRPYYSDLHNIYLKLYVFPIYLFFIIGIRPSLKTFWTLSFYIITLVCVFSASVILTCDDWLNRFIMPILPFIIIISTKGFFHFKEIITRLNKLPRI